MRWLSTPYRGSESSMNNHPYYGAKGSEKWITGSVGVEGP